MPSPFDVSSRRARRYDRIARWIITLGGIAVIASVIAIVAMIVSVTLPLFQRPQADLVATTRLPETVPASRIVGAGVEAAIRGDDIWFTVWTSDGVAHCIDGHTGKQRYFKRLPPPENASGISLSKAEQLNATRWSLVWANGAASLVEVPTAEKDDVRTLASVPAPETRPRQVLLRRSGSGAITRAALLADGTIAILRQTTAESFTGDEETKTNQVSLRSEVGLAIQALAMDHEGSTLYAGTRDGLLARWKFDDSGEVEQREVVRAFSDRRPITSLALALGDVSLVVGDAQGQLTTWCLVNADDTRKLRQIHDLQAHDATITQILPSGRNKTLLSVDEKGVIHFDYLTSERHLLSIPTAGAEQGGPPRAVAYNTRGDTLGVIDPRGDIRVWRLRMGSPEVSWRTLFGKVFYEGYDSADYVWQTTGGEDFEPKYSLVPLLFGTLKGTFYAMLFAGPIALFGAAYVSYFTTPGWRKTIKPVVEIMATVPSVVIGFLVALWLAPLLESWLLAFFLSLMTLPLVFVAFMFLWQALRQGNWAKRIENGYEFLLMPLVFAVGIGLAAWLSGPLEDMLFRGNFRQWLFQALGMPYDQRNNIIIAFGLGFTVIPIIFSIAEDSLSNVPYNMTAASMALGASRWQTFSRVILPSASPGIFAAMMIGFGRAVGETMIVLMATGNTPILAWSPLNGMRTLSANIAVEIPEAPVGETLYRVLFLCAVLLFLLTFLVNTAAELVRQHLRKRYGRF